MPSIAFIISNLRLGGAERWVANISRLLSERGCQVEVFVMENKIEQHLAPEVKLTILDATRKISGSFLARRRYARKLRGMMAVRESCDLVISTLPYADQVAHMAKIGSVNYRIANTVSAEITRLQPAKRRRRLKRYQSIYRGQKLIAVSAGVKDDLVNFLGMEESDIQKIYNPIDVSFLRQKADEQVSGMPDEPYLVHSGRFAFQKRHDILLDTWKIFQSQKREDEIKKLVLLTEDHEDLRKLIRERGLEQSVIVTGYQKNPYPWVRSAKCLVLSSEREGMPNVLLEALALGVPIASTDCPSGPRELLEHHHPRALAQLNDPASLSGAIEYSLTANFSDAIEMLSPFQPSVVLDQLLSLTNH